MAILLHFISAIRSANAAAGAAVDGFDSDTSASTVRGTSSSETGSSGSY